MLDGKMVILLAEDEAKLLRVFKDFLIASGYEVLAAKDGEEALNIYYENNSIIDLLLLDVSMPRMDGITLLDEIRKSSAVPAIFITARGEEYDEIKGFEIGADDYIVKPVSQTILKFRIEAVLKRLGVGNDAIISVGDMIICGADRTISFGDVKNSLTRREYDLIYYLAINIGQILTREQILNAVWGYEFDGDMRTVDTHIKQLRNKMGDWSIYLKTVHRVGYKLEVPYE